MRHEHPPGSESMIVRAAVPPAPAEDLPPAPTVVDAVVDVELPPVPVPTPAAPPEPVAPPFDPPAPVAPPPPPPLPALPLASRAASRVASATPASTPGLPASDAPPVRASPFGVPTPVGAS